MAERKAALWTKEYIAAVIIAFFINLTTNMLFSTLSIYGKGMTNSEYYAGLLTTAFTFAALGSRLFVSKLFDILSLKKVLLLGVTVTSIAAIGYLLADNPNLFMLVRILHGVGFGIASTAGITLITMSLPKERLLEGIGYAGIFDTAAMALSAGIVLSITNSDYLLFDRAFILTFIVTLFSFASAVSIKERGVLSKTEKTEEPPKKAEGKLSTGATIGILTLIPVILSLIVNFSQSSVSIYLSVFALERHMGNISMYFMLYPIMSLISRLLTSRLVERFGEKSVLTTAILLIGGCLVAIAYTNTPYTLFLLAIPYGLASGVFTPIFNVWILNTVSEDKQGVANAFYYASIDAGLGLGGLLWSGVADSLGYGNLFIVAGALMAVCWLYYIAMNKKYPRK